MRLSVTSKSSAEASLTPVSGIATLLLLVSREMRLMSALLEKSRKASGTMQVLMSLMSSRPMGQAQRRPWGRYRHRWLQPPLSSAQGFVPKQAARGKATITQSDCKQKVKLIPSGISHTMSPPSKHAVFFLVFSDQIIFHSFPVILSTDLILLGWKASDCFPYAKKQTQH